MKIKKYKKFILILFKLLSSTALIIYLIKLNKLKLEHFNQLAPGLISAMTLFFVVIHIISIIRWKMIISALDGQLKYIYLFTESWKAQFFDFIGGGFVAGDIFKIVKINNEMGKKHTGITIFKDRLISLSSLLFLLLTISIPVSLLNQFMIKSTVLLLLLVILKYLYKRLTIKDICFLHTISIIGHLVRLFAIMFILFYLDIFSFSLISPSLLGLIIEQIPISFMGIGLGHMSFELLLSSNASINGLLVYNYYLLGKIIFKMLGLLLLLLPSYPKWSSSNEC